MKKQRVADIHQGIFHSKHYPHLDVRITLGSDRPYAPHLHDRFSLGAVLSGQTRLTTPQATHVLERGEAVLIAPEQVHACNPVNGAPRSYYMFYIDREWVYERLDAACDGLIRIDNPVMRDPEFFARLTALAEAIRNDSGEEGLDACLMDCLAARCRVSPPLPTGKRLSHRRLCREAFIRRFRRDAGIPPGSYRQCLRLAKAQRLLRDGSGICRTAADCGYADQSHLHRMCVKYLAATPKQLQAKKSLSFNT